MFDFIKSLFKGKGDVAKLVKEGASDSGRKN